MNLTLAQYIKGVQDKTLDPKEVVSQYLAKAKKDNEKYNAFVRFHEDYVQEHLDDFADKPLAAAPIAIKDLILTKGYVSSSASKILENYVSPYSATCFTKLEEAGAMMIGKANCDQFGMGTTNENSHFGPVINPYGTNRIPGGSSGGSAAAVAADMCIAALGTDTGGSSRQPAALCNVVGLKPTYGRISRYGVAPLASSLDQVGIFSKTVQDASILLETMSGFDPHDATSGAKDPIPALPDNADLNWVKKLKIALPKQAFTEGLDSRIKENTLAMVEKLKSRGAQIEEVDMPLLTEMIPVYYVLMPAEASTNLARLDGLRYGYQGDTFAYETMQDYYEAIKTEGFLEETKRRILMGTYVLSSENYEGYYLKAKRIQKKMQADMEKVYQSYDCIITPTSPDLAWRIGSEKSQDPVKMYLADVYTVTANLCHICAMSVPNGFAEEAGEQLPVGIQLMANKRREDVLFGVGSVIEGLVD